MRFGKPERALLLVSSVQWAVCECESAQVVERLPASLRSYAGHSRRYLLFAEFFLKAQRSQVKTCKLVACVALEEGGASAVAEKYSGQGLRD